MISSIISRLVILIFGTLYPVYASYKAVRSKDVKGYVQWMMYWIVFGLFTCTETITDIFFSWFPFYYEIKILVVFWLLSPATKGSSILYRKFVHPTLSNREQEIDECISKAKQQTYRQVLDLGSKGVTVLMQTALKGGGGIVNQLRKSYSLSDLSEHPGDEAHEEADGAALDPRLLRKRRGRSPHRSSSTNSAIYFSEIDVRNDRMVSSVKSVEDISSGYSSGEALHAGMPLKVQAREGLHRTGSLTRSRTTRVTRSNIGPTSKKSTVASNSDESDENEVFDTNIIFLNDHAKNINNLSLAETQTNQVLSSRIEYGQLLTKMQTYPVLPSVKHSDEPLAKMQTNLVVPSRNYESDDSESEFFDSTSENSNFLLHDHKHGNTVYFNNNNKQVTTACDQDEIHMNLDVVTKFMNFPLLPNISNSQNYVTQQSSSRNNGETETTTSPTYKSSQNNAETTISENGKSTSEHLLEALDSEKLLKTSQIKARGGKYNKKIAPSPPNNKEITKENSPIKATLVLKPGVIRNLPNKSLEQDGEKQIFLHQSPKLPRRRVLRSKSPSPSSRSSSSSKNKLDVLSKMLHKIPKKISDKRHSWQEFFTTNKENKIVNTTSLLKAGDPNNRLSKSENTLTKIHEYSRTQPQNFEEIPTVILKRTSSQISIKSLKESPLASRRLKIIRTYVDQDID